MYDPSKTYIGLDKDCDDYKVLRIEYIKRYKWAIKRDYFWMERHYFHKLLTCIRYNNFSDNIVSRLLKVFLDRATYLSWYLFNFCDDLRKDAALEAGEKADLLKNAAYDYCINKSQKYYYHGSLRTDLMRLFIEYKKNGFAVQEAIDRYDECKFLFKYSHMEREMMECLGDMGIQVIREYSFKDLTNSSGRFLRFDGMIYKGNQMLLIECQGPQHYQPVSFFGGDAGFERLRENDNFKKIYCRKNGIPLLCIKYDHDVYSAIRKFIDRKEYPDLIYET